MRKMKIRQQVIKADSPMSPALGYVQALRSVTKTHKRTDDNMKRDILKLKNVTPEIGIFLMLIYFYFRRMHFSPAYVFGYNVYA